MSAVPLRLGAWRGAEWHPSVPRLAVYGAGVLPAIWLFFAAFTDRLGADPLKELEHGLGLWGLKFLVAGLAVTPLRRFTGVSLMRYRRALGLLAFLYVLLHLGVYVALDQFLDWEAIWRDIVKRPYITIGIAAFLLLIPLAATSTNGMLKRLGGKAWKRLHRLVYPAVALGALHYLLLVKSWPLEPIVYMALVLALLALRLVPSRTPPRPRA